MAPTEVMRDNSLTPLWLGIDLGGTKVMAAIGDVSGDIVIETNEATDLHGGEAVLDQLVALACRLAGECGPGASIAGAVVGIPGAVHPNTGTASMLPNISHLSGIDMAQRLGDLLGFPVLVENDVNLAMLGESRRGAARGARDAAFISLGTGVGLGLLVNGGIVRGSRGAAGEISHLPLGPNLERDEARRIGPFELAVGSQAIVRRYNDLSDKPADTVKQVFGALLRNDSAAAATLDWTAYNVGLAIASLQALLDPELVVLGGSIGMRPELLSRIQANVPSLFDTAVPVLASGLGNRAGLIGALSLAPEMFPMLGSRRCKTGGG